MNLETLEMIKNYNIYLCFGAFAQWMRAQKAIKNIAFILLPLVCLQPAAATRHAQSGVVTRVVDGDTLWVKTSAIAQPLKVRIHGIDAPEICQSGGVVARDALKLKVWGRRVTVISAVYDHYGRTVGTVHMQGQDIGRWMVIEGHAWVYSYRSRKALYGADFSQAQRERRGLFNATLIEEPRVFRKRYGFCQAR